ncbi:fimbrial biogenesis chaperone [Caulobacter soli]|uniref:fimbrial biogenesis chaperone n=1 Tax=Caulobacter soli TaxID=2708539 RepID=UPI0013EA0608|nr:molecular chaperone [Caulobacter soli]
MTRRPLLAAALIALMASAWDFSPAVASTLRVSPVGLDLPSGQNAATLNLFNDDATPLNVQVRVFRWRQVDGKDVLEPASGVVASPPISKVAPGAARTIRVVRLDPKLPEKQEAYRLIVDELPPPLSDSGRQVTLLMRHSIPLFFAASADKARVEWRLDGPKDGPALTAINTGGRHLRVSNLKVVDAAGDVLAERKGLVGYALPGSKMTWPTGPFAPAPGLRLVADTDVGPIDAPLAGD